MSRPPGPGQRNDRPGQIRKPPPPRRHTLGLGNKIRRRQSRQIGKPQPQRHRQAHQFAMHLERRRQFAIADGFVRAKIAAPNQRQQIRIDAAAPPARHFAASPASPAAGTGTYRHSPARHGSAGSYPRSGRPPSAATAPCARSASYDPDCSDICSYASRHRNRPAEAGSPTGRSAPPDLPGSRSTIICCIGSASRGRPSSRSACTSRPHSTIGPVPDASNGRSRATASSYQPAWIRAWISRSGPPLMRRRRPARPAAAAISPHAPASARPSSDRSAGAPG